MPSPIIAILGGGQLGRMFLENALRYDARVHVLDPDPHCSCAHLATSFTVGNFNHHDTVMRFATDAEVVGIEIEHVSVSALEELESMGKRVIPSPSVLRTIQDKGLQKQFYRDHGIPTADFALLEGRGDIAINAHLLPAFLKARTGGYDGRGVMPLDDLNDVEGAFDGPCVLEKRASIAVELAVLVVQAGNGTQVTYDPVEMVFDARFNLVDHLRAPARVTGTVIDKARRLAGDVARAFAAPGLYAVELFLTTDGDVLVNETAPRAHNSGHHTIEACPSSQFDQLLRLYMGWPLGSPRLDQVAAMVNLVGEGGVGAPVFSGLEDILHVPGTFVHSYGKRETRTGRKMGHVTILAPDHDALDQAIAVTRLHGSVIPG